MHSQTRVGKVEHRFEDKIESWRHYSPTRSIELKTYQEPRFLWKLIEKRHVVTGVLYVRVYTTYTDYLCFHLPLNLASHHIARELNCQ